MYTLIRATVIFAVVAVYKEDTFVSQLIKAHRVGRGRLFDDEDFERSDTDTDRNSNPV